MVIRGKIFRSSAWAHINDGEVEITLPEWSGRMDRAETLGELATLKAFIAQVESALSDTSVPTQRDTDTPLVEQPVPAQRDTDTAPSERAQVVEDAVREDEAADDKSLCELHDEYIRHWEDWKDWGDYGYGPADNPFQSWLKLNYPKAYRRSMVIDQRQSMRFRREIARERGARPRAFLFKLAPDIRTFEGKVYRVVDVPGWSSHWGA